MNLRMALRAVSVLVLLGSPVAANGLGEDRPFQFKDTAQRAVDIGSADLIERKKGGFYDSFRPASSIFNTNVTDCSFATNCLGTGSAANAGLSNDATVGSQTLMQNTGSGSLNGSVNQSNSGSQSAVPVGTPLQ